jgi:hypothetical protein
MDHENDQGRSLIEGSRNQKSNAGLFILGGRTPSPPNLVIRDLDDIPREIGCSFDRGCSGRWFGHQLRSWQRRLNRFCELAARLGNPPAAIISYNVAAGENIQARRAGCETLHPLGPISTAGC